MYMVLAGCFMTLAALPKHTSQMKPEGRHLPAALQLSPPMTAQCRQLQDQTPSLVWRLLTTRHVSDSEVLALAAQRKTCHQSINTPMKTLGAYIPPTSPAVQRTEVATQLSIKCGSGSAHQQSICSPCSFLT